MPDMRRNESFSFIVRAGEFSDNKVEVKVTAGDFELTTRVNNLIIDNHHGSWHSEVALDANQTYYVVCVGSRNSMVRHLVALPITSLAMLTELTIDENWLNGVLLRVKVSGEHEDTTHDRARRTIMQSFSALNQILPGFNSMLREHGTFSRGRFYSAQYDPSLRLFPNRDFKKPVYQMLAVLESGSVLPCEIIDLMTDTYINSTMSPYVHRQDPVLMRRNISHDSITSSTFIANAPGIGESKISYVDFLNEWRQVCV